MREIKFRAWDQYKKKMYYFGLLEYMSVNEDTQDSMCSYDGRHNGLMQYVGLKDRNGKEIYEGDIATYKWDYDNEILMKIIFKDGEFRLSSLRDDYPFKIWDIRICDENHKIEVTGNIYQNPELL